MHRGIHEVVWHRAAGSTTDGRGRTTVSWVDVPMRHVAVGVPTVALRDMLGGRGQQTDVVLVIDPADGWTPTERDEVTVPLRGYEGRYRVVGAIPAGHMTIVAVQRRA